MKPSVAFRLRFASVVAATLVLNTAGCQGTKVATQSSVIPQTPTGLTVVPAFKRVRVLHAFDPTRDNDDGATPQSKLIAFGAKFYGTTWTGGALHGWGTVYAIDSTGHERTLHSFLGGYSYTDGANPYSGVTAVGNVMYGTTFAGGADNDGTVFSITTAGVEKIIHNFGANGDGYKPAGDLLYDKGVLYGTTTYGGTNCSGNCGTVFAVTGTGSERIVHSFGDTDGARPYGGLIKIKRMLYGTTVLGGGYYAGGTVFAVSPNGHQFRTLHIFGYGADGSNPYGTLLLTHGSLYGTTEAGGTHRAGTIFKLGLDGSEKVLYSFTGTLDGARPLAGLIEVDGALVGTTSGGGGGCGCGTIFSVDFKGDEKTLHLFDGIHDGEYPEDTLLLSGSYLFGTAWTGGPHQFGTVFRYTLKNL